MKLTTIWTTKAMSLSERVSRTKEWGWMALAHRLPRKLAYWSLIDSGVRYMGGPYDPHEVIPEVPFMTVLERAGKGVETT